MNMPDLAARLCGFEPCLAGKAATVYKGLPSHEYHAMPELSASQIHAINARGLAAYRRERTQPRTTTEAMDLGTVVHSLLFGDVSREVHVWSGADRRTKAGKEEHAEAVAVAVNERKTLIKVSDYDRAIGIAAVVLNNPIVGPILDEPGNGELTIVWPDAALGVDCRARIDWLADRTDAPIIDVKVVGSLPPSPRAWAYKALGFGYHIQADHYTDAVDAAGMGRRDFWFVLVCSEAPHEVAVFRFGEWALHYAAAQRLKAARMLTGAQLTGEYPEKYAGKVFEVPQVSVDFDTTEEGSGEW
jgi:hypothetical protein